MDCPDCNGNGTAGRGRWWAYECERLRQVADAAAAERDRALERVDALEGTVAVGLVLEEGLVFACTPREGDPDAAADADAIAAETPEEGWPNGRG